jgi:outer membrane lipoprotein-sorting protein
MLQICYRHLFLNILFCVFVQYAPAQDDKERPVSDAEPVIEKLNTKAQSISTFQCEFKQVKYLAYLDASVESNGKFNLKKKNLARWEYVEPYKYILVIKDGKLTVKGFEGNKDQMQKGNKFLENLDELIESLFGGTIGMDQNFNKALFENGLFYQLILIPKSPQTKSVFKQIIIYFEKTSLEISSLKITEATGDFTSLLFKNRIYNKPISDSLFKVE